MEPTDLELSPEPFTQSSSEDPQKNEQDSRPCHDREHPVYNAGAFSGQRDPGSITSNPTRLRVSRALIARRINYFSNSKIRTEQTMILQLSLRQNLANSTLKKVERRDYCIRI